MILREFRPLPAFVSLALGCVVFSFDGFLPFSSHPAFAARAKSENSAPKAPAKKRKIGQVASNGPEKYSPQIITGATSYEDIWAQFDGGDESAQHQAISRMKAVLKKSPDDVNAHYYLGLMQMKTGPLSQAEEHLRFTAAAYPDSADITLKLAQVLIDQGRGDEATPLLEKARNLDPKNAGPLSLLGLKALVDGDLKGAVDLLMKAKAIDPENRDTLRGLGIALVGLERPAEAVDVLTRVLSLDSHDAEAHYQLGKAYEALGKVKEASEEFVKAKSMGAKSADMKGLIGFDLARALAQTGRYDAAVTEYQKAIKKSPDAATGWFELAELYLNMGQTPRAVSAFKKAFEKGNRFDAILRIGEIYRKEGNLEEALSALNQISRRKDEWGERARAAISEISQEKSANTRDNLLEKASSGDEVAREKTFLQMLRSNPKDPDALSGLKDLAMSRGDLGQVDYYNKLMVKAGLMTKSDAAEERSKLEDRSSSGDDLAAWENRLEEFKQHDEYDKALNEWKKLKAYAVSQLEFWRKQRDSSERTAMIEATKHRITNLNDMEKDLREQKKLHGKK
ncbi:MAG: tetratricopeptide repeat protein [Candidatus Riflebacteria bacterium]|nr:tetratricopeptide repeat protein [Candidatus Riflebacteria bacterium]